MELSREQLVKYLAELVQLDVNGRTQSSAEVTRTRADVAETLTPCKRVSLLLHGALDLLRQTNRHTVSDTQTHRHTDSCPFFFISFSILTQP